MKPFIIILTVVFILSLAYGGYESYKTSRANKKAQEAMLLNKDYIQKIEIERAKQDLSRTYADRVDKDIVDIMRIATEDDLLQAKNNVEKEKEAGEIFKEKVTWRLWLAILFITASSIILSFENIEGLNFSIGSLFVLGATICWGLENNCTRRISNKSTYQIVTIKGLCSGFGSIIVALVSGKIGFALKYIPFALLLGFVAYGLSIFTYIRAQKYLGAAKTSAAPALKSGTCNSAPDKELTPETIAVLPSILISAPILASSSTYLNLFSKILLSLIKLSG